MRRDWADIAAYSNQLGFTTTLFTNGTLIEEHFSSVLDLGLKVAVSLDGIDEQVNRMLRGNSYRKVMEAIHLLVEAGKEKGYTVDLRDYQLYKGEDPWEWSSFLEFLKGSSNTAGVSTYSLLHV